MKLIIYLSIISLIITNATYGNMSFNNIEENIVKKFERFLKHDLYFIKYIDDSKQQNSNVQEFHIISKDSSLEYSFKVYIKREDKQYSLKITAFNRELSKEIANSYLSFNNEQSPEEIKSNIKVTVDKFIEDLTKFPHFVTREDLPALIWDIFSSTILTLIYIRNVRNLFKNKLYKNPIKNFLSVSGFFILGSYLSSKPKEYYNKLKYNVNFKKDAQ